jgi:hypothetical protein
MLKKKKKNLKEVMDGTHRPRAVFCLSKGKAYFPLNYTITPEVAK